ncbi:MAG: hypothetical protein HXK70_04095 [Clostridiales bacterium]|nr:hypothetical protein [Clostridiales bacterium]
MKIVKIICILILVVILGLVSYVGYEYVINKKDIVGINRFLGKGSEDKKPAPAENKEQNHEKENRENTPNLNNNKVYKKVDGVEILEEDKDKMIIRAEVKAGTKKQRTIKITASAGTKFEKYDTNTVVDFGDGKGKVALKDGYYSSKNDTPYYGVERELKEGVYIIKIENPSNIEYNSLKKMLNNPEKDVEESLENQNTIKNTILNFGKNMEYPTVIGKKSDDEPVSLSRYIGIDDIKDSIVTNNKGDVVFIYSKFLLGGKKNEKDITKELTKNAPHVEIHYSNNNEE